MPPQRACSAALWVAALIVLPLAGAALPGPAAAQALPADLLACRDIAEAEARLACYDRAVERREDAAADTASLLSSEDLFGRDLAEIQRKVDEATGREELQRIAGEVVELIEIGPDRIAVKLENGQIWRQTVPGPFFLREGHTVEIRRASLGSYMMSRVGSKRSIRVERAD